MNVEEGYSMFLNEINDAVETCIPNVKKSLQKKNNKWMTKDCKTCIRKKRKAWRNYVHNQNKSNFRKYCEARTICTRVIRKAKRKFEKSIVDNTKIKTKCFWSYVEDKSKSKAGNYDLKDGDGNLTSDIKTKADLLNKFFALVYVKEPDGQLPDFESKYSDEPITDISVDVETVKKLLYI